MYQICFANMLQIYISDTIMYTLAEMNVSNMYYIFDTQLTFLVVYWESGSGYETSLKGHHVFYSVTVQRIPTGTNHYNCC